MGDPQKKDADVVIEVLPTWEPSDEIGLDNSDKPLRVRLIQKADNKLFDPAYILDKGSEVAWVPDGGKLKAASPGLKFTSSCEKYFDQDVVVLEMVGDLSKLDDVSYVEGQISDSGAKTDGELAKQMLDNASFPGSMNGSLPDHLWAEDPRGLREPHEVGDGRCVDVCLPQRSHRHRPVAFILLSVLMTSHPDTMRPFRTAGSSFS